MRNGMMPGDTCYFNHKKYKMVKVEAHKCCEKCAFDGRDVFCTIMKLGRFCNLNSGYVFQEVAENNNTKTIKS